MVKLYNDDCLAILPNIKNHSIDLILCDLPYGVTQNKSDVVIPFDPLWEQYKRIIRDGRAIVLFAQGIFYVDLINSNRKMFKYDIVWDKVLTSGFLNAKVMPLRQHEQIAIFGKGKILYNPQMKSGAKNHSKGQKKECVNNNYGKFSFVESRTDGLKYPTSIVTFSKSHPSISKHRTEKPVSLLEYLILTYSNEGDTVLDNCMGSGSTGVACKNTGRNFIGIEIDKNYFNIAQERINNAGKNKLF